MRINQGLVNEIAKWILIVLLFVFYGGGFFACGVWMLVEGLLIGLFLVLLAVLWVYVMTVAFYAMAAVTLSDAGVSVRVFVRTKHYSWDKIVRAGVLWSARKGGYYNDLVLLPETGVLCDSQGKAFVYRNQFHLIHLPYTPGAVSYVLSHYGPLDFDYSNGQGMQKR